MSTDWVEDIAEMHDKFGFHSVVTSMDDRKLKKFLQFRISFLQEELDELKKSETPSDAVDALIDLIVVSIGTLDLFGVDAHRAWDTVHSANMTKEVGMKESRKNDFGFPDLVKPIGFEHPDHEDNTGFIERVFLG